MVYKKCIVLIEKAKIMK